MVRVFLSAFGCEHPDIKKNDAKEIKIQFLMVYYLFMV